MGRLDVVVETESKFVAELEAPAIRVADNFTGILTGIVAIFVTEETEVSHEAYIV